MKGYQQRLWKREDRTVGQKGKRLQEEDKEANVYGVRDLEGIYLRNICQRQKKRSDKDKHKVFTVPSQLV